MEVRNHSNQAITFHEIKINEQKQDHDILAQEAREERSWRSCCFQIERDSTIHFSKLTISVCTMAVCTYQLITLTDCSAQHMYTAIFSIILGYWLK